MIKIHVGDLVYYIYPTQKEMDDRYLGIVQQTGGGKARVLWFAIGSGLSTWYSPDSLHVTSSMFRGIKCE